jgi:hypothetical protein
MIKISQDIVEIDFTKANTGVVTMSVEDNRLLIQEMDAPIGSKNEFPQIKLEFYKLWSIDNLISQLLIVRHNLELQIENMDAEKLRSMVEQLQREIEELKSTIR